MNSRIFARIVFFLIGSVILLSCEEYDDVDFSDEDELSTLASVVGTYQAEDRSFQSGCSVGKVQPGYTGTGYMDFGGNGSLVEWNTVNVTAAGVYTLKFRYANGSWGKRRCSLTVNGNDVSGEVEFDSTGAWSTWKLTAVNARLRAGKNKIRVTATTAAGGPNLDKMDVIGNDTITPGLVAKDFVGHYERTPVTNNWHKVDITLESNKLWWKNAAGVRWSLNLANGVLKSGADCPYGVQIIGVVEQPGSVPVKALKFNRELYYKSTDDDDDDSVVKVFILAGQSNMVGAAMVSPGQAQLDKNGGQGTLEYLVENPQTRPTYRHLVTSSGEWTKRNDVWLIDLDRQGPLTITKTSFGPELQFGHVMGKFLMNPVLIIKTSWGGKSLAVDFRPPSSGGTVGPYYKEMVQRVHTVLGKLKQFMPSYQNEGYEIAGFGWHQGWNDRIKDEFTAEYQTNCVNLINDLRAEFRVPKMPVVIATTGMGGWNETQPRALALMKAQLAVPTDPRLKQRNVAAVETRGFWRDEAVSPTALGYHWNRNAETYFLIGNGMGRAMINLSSR